MYDVIKNACNSKEVPFVTISSKENNLLFIEYLLKVNDITKHDHLSLSSTEIKISSYIINFIMENGEIVENKVLYNRLLDEMISKNLLKTKSWNQMRKNIRDKGLIMRDEKHYTIQIDPIFYRMVQFKAVNFIIV